MTELFEDLFCEKNNKNCLAKQFCKSIPEEWRKAFKCYEGLKEQDLFENLGLHNPEIYKPIFTIIHFIQFSFFQINF